MKALTLHEPWASLVAHGVKTIETRSWTTRYRGPLAIHAGKQHYVGPWSIGLLAATDGILGGIGGYPDTFPLGHVVGTVDLVEVCPTDTMDGFSMIVGDEGTGTIPPDEWIVGNDDTGETWSLGGRRWNLDDNRPLGDFAPGRFAWLLDNAELFETPVPARGKQGLWNWDESRF